MASSRTGTAKWIKVRNERRRLGIEQGDFNCPNCNVPLDYEYSRRPNSAEVDHIIPHAQGGKDVLENTRILCRSCNQSLGGRSGRRKQQQAVKPSAPLRVSRQW